MKIQYEIIKEIITETDSMEKKIKDTSKDTNQTTKKFNIDLEERLINQSLQIQDLYKTLNTLTTQLKLVNREESEMAQEAIEIQDPELEIEKLYLQGQEDAIFYNQIQEKLNFKFNRALEITNKRTMQVINDAESVAVNLEISNMSEETRIKFQQHGKQKQRLDNILNEYLNTSKLVDEMENLNRDLVMKNIGVEWNLAFQDKHEDQESDDEEVVLGMEWIKEAKAPENIPKLPRKDVVTTGTFFTEVSRTREDEKELEEAYNRLKKNARSRTRSKREIMVVVGEAKKWDYAGRKYIL